MSRRQVPGKECSRNLSPGHMIEDNRVGFVSPFSTPRSVIKVTESIMLSPNDVSGLEAASKSVGTNKVIHTNLNTSPSIVTIFVAHYGPTEAKRKKL